MHKGSDYTAFYLNSSVNKIYWGYRYGILTMTRFLGNELITASAFPLVNL